MIISGQQMGEFVKREREAAGISVRDLAKRSHVCKDWIMLLEEGKLDSPGIKKTTKVLDALGIYLKPRRKEKNE